VKEQARTERVPWRHSAFMRVALVAAVVMWPRVHAQDDERRLWDSEFLKKRQPAPAAPAAPRTSPPAAPPASRTSPPATPPPSRTPPVYKRATPATPGNDKAPGEMIGVTIWRLRPSSASDGQDSRLLLQEDDKSSSTEWTPQRVEAATTFAAGESVRLSIESPRTGFLYVIDREEYDDGSTSDPYLIFPTLRMRAGNNAVSAGRVIELPERSAFRLKPMRPDYKGELLTLLVTAEPLPELSAGPTIRKLDPRLVEQWERRWSSTIERFEMVDGAGRTYTRAEKEAGAEGRLLTQEDELPQTLFRVVAKPDSPLMVAVPLRIAR
jgi:hypothetical protein